MTMRCDTCYLCQDGVGVPGRAGFPVSITTFEPTNPKLCVFNCVSSTVAMLDHTHILLLSLSLPCLSLTLSLGLIYTPFTSPHHRELDNNSNTLHFMTDNNVSVSQQGPMGPKGDRGEPGQPGYDSKVQQGLDLTIIGI